MNMPEKQPGASRETKTASVINEVKYSLAELLVEVEEERQNSLLARELVDQAEIAGILKKNRRRSRGRNGRR